MSKEIRFGILGTGRIGMVHLETILKVEGVKILMVAEKIESLANSVAKRFNIPRVVSDWEEVLENPEIDAVVICTPTTTHTEIILAAAKAKKHIFCEKPLDVDLENISKIINAIEENGVKLQVGFNRRFDANFRRVHECVKKGEIGVPYMIHVISRDPAPPSIDYIKQSGGLFMDMMIHDFDMVEFLLGSPVVEIYAMGKTLVDPKIEEAGDIDSAIVSLKFENGAMGTIECCRKAVYGYDQRVEVLGSDGAIKTDNNFPNTAIISTSNEIKRDLPYNFFMTRYAEAYRTELISFAECLIQNKPTPVSAVEARTATVLAAAALKSLKEKRPVQISEIFQDNSKTQPKKEASDSLISKEVETECASTSPISSPRNDSNGNGKNGGRGTPGNEQKGRGKPGNEKKGRGSPANKGRGTPGNEKKGGRGTPGNEKKGGRGTNKQ